MCRKFIGVFGAVFLLAVSATTLAQEKIAVVNIQAAILQSAYGKAEMAKLESSSAYTALITEFEGLRADLQALDSEAQGNASSWDAERLAEYNKQRQFLQADLELNGRKIQADQQAAVQSINAAMTQRAQAALQELIEEESITLLLKEDSVYHATTVHDITQKLALKIGN